MEIVEVYWSKDYRQEDFSVTFEDHLLLKGIWTTILGKPEIWIHRRERLSAWVSVRKLTTAVGNMAQQLSVYYSSRGFKFSLQNPQLLGHEQLPVFSYRKSDALFCPPHLHFCVHIHQQTYRHKRENEAPYLCRDCTPSKLPTPSGKGQKNTKKCQCKASISTWVAVVLFWEAWKWNLASQHPQPRGGPQHLLCFLWGCQALS